MHTVPRLVVEYIPAVRLHHCGDNVFNLVVVWDAVWVYVFKIRRGAIPACLLLLTLEEHEQ